MLPKNSDESNFCFQLTLKVFDLSTAGVITRLSMKSFESHGHFSQNEWSSV